MKRRITLSIALVLSVVLLSLMSSDSTANAQPPQRFSASSGVVPLPVGQNLRITIAGERTETIRVRFAWMKYMAAGCIGMPAMCRHTVESQGVTASATVDPDEALSFDVQGGAPVNVTVRSSSRDARVVFQIINISTGEVVVAVNGGGFTVIY